MTMREALAEQRRFRQQQQAEKRRRVMALLAEGRSPHWVAERLHMSQETVRDWQKEMGR